MTVLQELLRFELIPTLEALTHDSTSSEVNHDLPRELGYAFLSVTLLELIQRRYYRPTEESARGGFTL